MNIIEQWLHNEDRMGEYSDTDPEFWEMWEWSDYLWEQMTVQEREQAWAELTKIEQG